MHSFVIKRYAAEQGRRNSASAKSASWVSVSVLSHVAYAINSCGMDYSGDSCT